MVKRGRDLEAGWRRLLLRLGAAALLLALGGCASLAEPGPSGHKRDPWENWNRKVFAFNEAVDEALLKPVATTYSELVPRPVRLGVDNFFGNIGDAWSSVNLFLQGRLKSGLNQTLRFAINSTMGFGGVIDIAGEAGIERNSEDMGRTFGRWGTGTGAYIVWPIFGPSSVRDTLALPFDMLASPSALVSDGGARVGIAGLRVINARANLLNAGRMLDDIALDKYTFVRDAYLARRNVVEDESDDDYEPIVPEKGTPQAGP
jgi:phospholipid-binding lipoprotein MlaA